MSKINIEGIKDEAGQACVFIDGKRIADRRYGGSGGFGWSSDSECQVHNLAYSILTHLGLQGTPRQVYAVSDLILKLLTDSNQVAVSVDVDMLLKRLREREKI